MFVPGESPRTFIIHPDIHNVAESAHEAVQLALAAGCNVLRAQNVRTRHIHPSTFLTSGKVDDMAQLVNEMQIDVVIVNTSLSPSQERNLERAFKCSVIDRNRLILDIFALRARSHEGKLQVELAQLEYLSTRLIRGWTHLERQKGGIGLRGPGESQLETDRRLLATRVTSLKKQLAQVRRQRLQNRKNRLRSATPSIALVGYTNAGKSTLFNLLTNSTSYVADKLFATLDTTSRRLRIPGIGNCVITDTVGFIRHLPHKLIEAFKATLEELPLADVLVHVIDASDDSIYQKIDAVQEVLQEIGADKIPQVIALNKSDLLSGTQSAIQSHKVIDTEFPAVLVSSQNGSGISLLHDTIARTLGKNWYRGWVLVQADKAGATRANLYRMQSVEEEQSEQNGDVKLRISLPRKYIRDIPQLIPLHSN